jgi:hypothetical protein
MNILDDVKAIFSRYELQPLMLPEGHNDVYSFLRAHPDLRKDYEAEKDDMYLFDKYRKYIPIGWYGFDIGSPIIPAWMEIIDEIVALCIKSDPDFEIHQIKLKYGGIRFYVETKIIEDIDDVEYLIMGNLFDNALIY